MLLFQSVFDTAMTKKTEKLGVGLTKEEKQRFRIEAAKRDMSMSELARKIILGELDELGEEVDSPNRKTMAQTAD
jgi:hypothetical protein